MATQATPSRMLGLLALLAAISSSGCQNPLLRQYPDMPLEASPTDQVARELDMVSLPEYVIEPPDILFLDAVRIVPKEPYIIREFDVLGVYVAGTPEPGEIAGEFQVQPDGSIHLGPRYKPVEVAGLTFREAEAEITRHLSAILVQPEVQVTLSQGLAIAPLQGDYIVYGDGTINLGVYGQVRVVGLTLEQAKKKIEEKLSERLANPELSIQVLAYNSKVYYVIYEGAGSGDRIVSLPITGSDTVLSAISQANNGLTPTSSNNIWVARPTPSGGPAQILPVDWRAISAGAVTSTNYELMPGDRVVIAGDKFVAAANFIDKLVNPFERMFSTTLLGTQTVQQINRFPRGQQQPQ